MAIGISQPDIVLRDSIASLSRFPLAVPIFYIARCSPFFHPPFMSSAISPHSAIFRSSSNTFTMSAARCGCRDIVVLFEQPPRIRYDPPNFEIGESKMDVRALDLYKLKPEFLPVNLAAHSVYVRPGELDLYANPDQWVYVGRTVHPNHLQAADVKRQGYCSRSLPAGRDWKRVARTWYDHPRSVQSQPRLPLGW